MYPDVNSLILLSEVFQTSIDKLIKGDIEIMKEKINEQEIKKLNYYGNIFGVHFAITILSAEKNLKHCLRMLLSFSLKKQHLFL